MSAPCRTIVAEAFGGPGVLRLRELPRQRPGTGEALVAVQYSGVAFADVLMRNGRYPGGPRPPFTPGWDLVGTVVAVGAGVDALLVGRRVAALSLLGGYADHAIVPVDRLVSIPQNVASEAAACLPLNYVTAWQMLRRVAHARAGETVLVPGAAGGVGSALLDLSACLGLRAYGVAAAHKATAVEDVPGAQYVRVEDLPEVSRQIEGFDIVLDPIGGRATWQAARLLGPRGRLVGFGFTGAIGAGPALFGAAWHMLNFSLRRPLLGSRRAEFFRLSRSVADSPERYRSDLTQLLEHLAARRLAPRVADVLPLEAAREAHFRLESRTVTGKLLLNAQA